MIDSRKAKIQAEKDAVQNEKQAEVDAVNRAIEEKQA